MKQLNQFKTKVQKNNEYYKTARMQAKQEKLFAIRPDSQKWYGVNMAAEIGTFLVNAFSFVTQSFAIFYFVYINVEGTMPPDVAFWFAAFVGVSLGLLIEFFKRRLNTIFFSEGFGKEKNWNPFTFVFVLVFGGVAVALTFYTCTAFGLYAQPSPELEDLETIALHYDNDIKDIDNQIAEYQAGGTRKAGSKKGEIKTAALTAIRELSTQITNLRAEKQLAVKEARQRNEKALEAHLNEKTQNGHTLGYISILLEFMFIGMFAFSIRYHWNSKLEDEEQEESHEAAKNQSNSHEKKTENIQNLGGGTARGIGFHQPKDIHQKNKLPKMEQTNVITSDTALPKFMKLTVQHVDFSDGTTIKEVDEKTIDRNIKTYIQRVNDTLDRIRKETDIDQKLYDSFQKRSTRLQYWNDKKGELLQECKKGLGL